MRKIRNLCNIVRVVPHKDYIGALNSHISTSAYSNPDVRRYEGRRIVYAVTYHGNPVAFLLQQLHFLRLLVGQNFGEVVVYGQFL